MGWIMWPQIILDKPFVRVFNVATLSTEAHMNKEIKLVQADQAPLGAKLMHPYVNECFGEITKLCRNPHYGWIGFQLNDSDSFNGWHKPTDLVRITL
jgi:hypothetical protein